MIDYEYIINDTIMEGIDKIDRQIKSGKIIVRQEKKNKTVVNR